MRLVDADEIKKRAHDIVLANGAKHRCFDTTTLFEIPTIEAEPKHGSWRHYEGTLTCSVCHTEIYDDIMELLGDDVPRYCPSCGARMDEVEE